MGFTTTGADFSFAFFLLPATGTPTGGFFCCAGFAVADSTVAKLRTAKKAIDQQIREFTRTTKEELG